MSAAARTPSGDEVFRQLQRMARADGAAEGGPTPTSEYVTRHGLESFLDRLTRTPHATDFVLKGGILLAAYGARRPTKDVDAEAVNASMTPEHIHRVVRDVAAVDASDGVTFDVGSITVQQIREEAEYPGLRMRVKATIGSQSITVTWDVSTGDPVVPPPSTVTLPRVLGEPIVMLGYAPETIVAEKGVTILERGITSTRWRHYVDIVRLRQDHGLEPDLLLESARAVAQYRGVTLAPIAPVVAGYGAAGQVKWAGGHSLPGRTDLGYEAGTAGGLGPPADR